MSHAHSNLAVSNLIVCNLTQKRFFAPFCALLCPFCVFLRSFVFALFCTHLRVFCVRPRLERMRLGTAEKKLPFLLLTVRN